MKKTIIASLIFFGFVIPLSTFAFTVPNVGQSLGLGEADLESTVINLVRFVLGFLALVAVIVMIWGGFQWMTAGGNDEKISTAKKLITNAVIGLIIVILSWAIVLFAVNVLSNATEGTI